MSDESPFLLRPALLADVSALHALISHYAAESILLLRSRSELFETIRDFTVACDASGAVVGCAALHIVNERLAEVKSLAVSDAVQGKGLGRLLVELCCSDAAGLGLERVFCLTYQIAFFERLGFTRVDRSRLPEKVWGECVRCNRFLNCDEVALWREV